MKLTPAASTRTRISPACGSGAATSAYCRTSGPPNPSIWIACMLPPSVAGGVNSDNGSARLELGDDGVDVVDAATPCSAACLLQRGPQARVVRQGRVGLKVGARRTSGK